MKHLWLRAEHRENEKRVGLTPQGATQLIKEGIKVSVEARAIRGSFQQKTIKMPDAKLFLQVLGKMHQKM